MRADATGGGARVLLAALRCRSSVTSKQNIPNTTSLYRVEQMMAEQLLHGFKMLILFLPHKKKRRVLNNRRILKSKLKSDSDPTANDVVDVDDDNEDDDGSLCQPQFNYIECFCLSRFGVDSGSDTENFTYLSTAFLPHALPFSLLDWFAAYKLPFSIRNINSPGEVASVPIPTPFPLPLPLAVVVLVEVKVDAKLWLRFVCSLKWRIDKCSCTRV